MRLRSVAIILLYIFSQTPSLPTLPPDSLEGQATTTISASRKRPLATTPFRQERYTIPAVTISTRVLDLQQKGIRGETPGNVLPLHVTIRYLSDGSGPRATGERGIGEETVETLSIAIHAAAHATAYDARFIDATIALGFQDAAIETPIIDGPSAGLSFAIVATATLLGDPFPPATCITGTITAEGDIGLVSGIYHKIEGCHFMYPRSRFILPAGQRSIDSMSNASRFGVTLLEAQSFEDAYETAIGKPLRTVE